MTGAKQWERGKSAAEEAAQASPGNRKGLQPVITLVSADACGVPTAATCTCGGTWERPADDPDALSFSGWVRIHYRTAGKSRPMGVYDPVPVEAINRAKGLLRGT